MGNIMVAPRGVEPLITVPLPRTMFHLRLPVYELRTFHAAEQDYSVRLHK